MWENSRRVKKVNDLVFFTCILSDSVFQASRSQIGDELVESSMKYFGLQNDDS